MRINQLGDIISKLSVLLARKHKAYLIILYLLTMLLSVIETVGVSIIMPFITVASNPDILDHGRYNDIYNFISNIFHFTTKNDFIIFFGITIVIFYIFRAIYNVVYIYILNKFALGTYTYLSKKCYSKFLSVPYRLYVQKNSSELHQGIHESNNVSNLLLYILQICSDVIIIIMLYVFMLLVNLEMTIILTAMFAILIFIIVKVIVKKNRAMGVISSNARQMVMRVTSESHGNFKIIKLKGCEDYNYNRFDDATKKFSHANVINTTLAAMPRSILESSGFSLLIISVIFILMRNGTVESIIPIIAMYALSLYRILPSVNKMLINISSISFLQNSLNIVHESITQKVDNEGNETIEFNKNLRLENVSFSYLTGKEVLHNVNLEIKKGDKIAITGNSGGGKSTLADILIGMNKPIGGKLYVDDTHISDSNIRSWRSNIGYIPQSIYLFDDTVAANVVFGSEYNEDRLIEVLKKARIWDLLCEKQGVNTIVGEGGMQLSGGQKQRIGIARALYTNPEILVLDEATSALDNETESQIMDEIYDVGKNKTLIIVAHRLSTIEKCDRRIIVDNGNVTELCEIDR
ncbi:MAG: ABC-type lipopolysaccharide transporter PglK [Termitinemataceae bacterium]|nr:MAG: ABC-type lipopolysaccharide transporter PglK [Termitinemataceae bacterium]